MNKNIEAKRQLKKGILIAVKRLIDNAQYDKTYSGVIKSVDDVNNKKYTVSINNGTAIYQNVGTIGGSCSVNENVLILAPMNNFNNIVILKS